MAQADLVEVIGHGARRSKTYGITPAGRAELRRWLVEGQPDRSKRDESGLRLFLTPLLGPADRRATFQRDLGDVDLELDALKDLRAELHDAGSPQAFAPQVELGIRINEVLRTWLLEQIAATQPQARVTASDPRSRSEAPEPHPRPRAADHEDRQ